MFDKYVIKRFKEHLIFDIVILMSNFVQKYKEYVRDMKNSTTIYLKKYIQSEKKHTYEPY